MYALSGGGGGGHTPAHHLLISSNTLSRSAHTHTNISGSIQPEGWSKPPYKSCLGSQNTDSLSQSRSPSGLLNRPALPSSAAQRWNNNSSHIGVTCHISNNMDLASGARSDIGILLKHSARRLALLRKHPKYHPVTTVENDSFNI